MPLHNHVLKRGDTILLCIWV